ncbi:MAG TPA: hypothetical protein VFW47_07135 [Phenylobacterium sp.]|nr:hypothetical protein [Phenylobacterium sp.]
MTIGPRGQPRTFRAALRGGLWQVTRDHVFHGDYESREAAIAGACEAARACEATGRAARVLGPGEAPIAHKAVAK